MVGVVTIPFRDEGKAFMTRAMDGLRDLRQYVDSLLIIDNQKIYEAFGDQNMMEGFKRPNEVLVTAVKSISEIITLDGEINVDMNDVRMVMENSGMTTMGIGEAEGEGKAQQAVEKAFESPLLNDCDLKSSTGLLINLSAPERTSPWLSSSRPWKPSRALPASLSNTSVDLYMTLTLAIR